MAAPGASLQQLAPGRGSDHTINGQIGLALQLTHGLVGKWPEEACAVLRRHAEDHVGIGSDLSITPIDGSDEYWAAHREFVSARIKAGIAAPAENPDVLFTVPELNSHRRMDLIADALAARGHDDRIIEKVIGGNWVRLCGEVWKG